MNNHCVRTVGQNAHRNELGIFPFYPRVVLFILPIKAHGCGIFHSNRKSFHNFPKWEITELIAKYYHPSCLCAVKKK